MHSGRHFAPLQNASCQMRLTTRWLYCVAWRQYSIRLEEIRYMHTRVVDANGISIALAVFAGLIRWQTD